MNESKQRSIRLLMDLQACQTAGSAYRGVGRFSSNLFENISSLVSDVDVFAHVADYLPYQYEFNDFPETNIIHTKNLPEIDTKRFYLGGELDKIDDELLSITFSKYKPDIINISHVFEGFSDRVALPSFNARSTGQIYSAIIHDVIPLVFPEYYLENEQYRKWYLYKCNWLRQADLLLSNSESSRVDAINYLGLDPDKVVTIHGGVSPIFKPSENRMELHTKLEEKYGLQKRFVLYTGGDDIRKNIEQSIKAFGLLPVEMRKKTSYVIICTMGEQRKRDCISIAKSCGIPLKNIVFTGRVSDEELANFYRACDLFIFPSLYEGLGLPILEAMACGAPVIGSNTSAIKELIHRPDALFDPKSKESIAERIHEVISDPGFESKLRTYSLERIKEFSWKKSAKLSLEAYDRTLKTKRENGIKIAKDFLLPKKRLAMFTPLPPCRSGIADYNAHFLPYLSNHFDIDLFVDNYAVNNEQLTSSLRIFPADQFDYVATKYDAILYEFGNSEFHVYMLPYLAKYPGVVGLHDAYLSGMFGYIDFNLGKTGSYPLEMLNAHGTVARHLFAPIQKCNNAVGESMVELPCTKKVLDQAIGVISHSPFNLDMARKHYPEGWQAPYRIIPQMISINQPWEKEKRDDIRTKFGFKADDFIITTFGHITWTKWGDRLLDAFLQSSLITNKCVHLVYAGELAKDDFGMKLKEKISKSKLEHRVHITGYLSEEAYENYLNISDLAVQLRTKSRGGTPKGVLDCLSHSLPVIINNDASFTDYPDGVAYKLSANPVLEEIKASVEYLFENEHERKLFAENGMEYVREQHNPITCAAAYASAINEFIDRQKRNTDDFQVVSLAPHIAGCQQQDLAIGNIASWINHISNPVFSKRKIYIDVSHIARTNFNTGIQRVVRNIVKEIYLTPIVGIEPIAVELVNDELHIAKDWLNTQGLITDIEQNNGNSLIQFNSGDILLMLDSSWDRYSEFHTVFKQARYQNVKIITAIYDILPLILPPGNFVEGGKEWFENWFIDALLQSDGLVCISKSVAYEVINYIDNKIDLNRYPQVGYWHLGSDFISEYPTKLVNKNILKIKNKKYLLMIGTIEPRKSHQLALSAMENLWENNHDLCLCIAGKPGWMVEDLMHKLRNHPLREERIFLYESVSDADIDYLYKNATGLLFLSKGEGFGLPLIEAANHGIPIICSDIPVFREIAGGFATYVKGSDSKIVTEIISKWWKEREAGNLYSSKEMPRLSWKESAQQLLDLITKNKYLN